LSKVALANFKERVPSFKDEHLICDNYFNLHEKFDLIIEQTFFCALDPKLRMKYAEHTAQLLNPVGKLIGLLFNDKLNEDHPPFGGDKAEYRTYFEPYFHIDILQTATNSIKPRKGRELFIKFEKRNESAQ